MSSNPEVYKGHNSTAELQSAASERSQELQKNIESSPETSNESKVERADHARREAKEVFAREAGKETRSGGEPTASAVRRVTKNEREASYKTTMQHIRAEMSAPARAFSKIIHSPAVEKSSEILGSSLARPNAVLAGSSTALVLVTGTYVIARTFGYQLSGFETIGAFLLGWALGIIYDYVRIMALGRRS